MARLTLDLSDAALSALEHCADQQHLSVTTLIQEYLGYLLAGGKPIASAPGGDITTDELTVLAEHGGAFDWLADEPDIYSVADSEPV